MTAYGSWVMHSIRCCFHSAGMEFQLLFLDSSSRPAEAHLCHYWRKFYSVSFCSEKQEVPLYPCQSLESSSLSTHCDSLQTASTGWVQKRHCGHWERTTSKAKGFEGWSEVKNTCCTCKEPGIWLLEQRGWLIPICNCCTKVFHALLRPKQTPGRDVVHLCLSMQTHTYVKWKWNIFKMLKASVIYIYIYIKMSMLLLLKFKAMKQCYKFKAWTTNNSSTTQ